MKTRCAVFALCFLALGAIMIPQVMASPICPVEDKEKITVASGLTDGQFGNGGSFYVQNQTRTAIDAFLTFCLEKSEGLNFSTEYTVYLDDGAVKGGNDGQTSPNYDPLDAKTAYLYSQFICDRDGLLEASGLADEAALSRAMQEAIWYLEEEITSITTGGAADTLIGLAANAAGDYGVKVMNLKTSSGGDAQSLLVQCECQPIPEPSTLAIWGLFGVCGLMVARRRRK